MNVKSNSPGSDQSQGHSSTNGQRDGKEGNLREVSGNQDRPKKQGQDPNGNQQPRRDSEQENQNEPSKLPVDAPESSERPRPGDDLKPKRSPS